jgi:ABC-type polysaccharide/polyol phosphate export permease
MGGPIGVPAGRAARELESPEMRSKWKTRELPPVIGVLVALVVFFGVVFGSVFIYDGSMLLGVVLFIIAVIAPVLYILDWRRKEK